MDNKITFGADPEFFVYHVPTKQIVPACGRFGGNKKAPVVLSEDGGYLEDGAVVEFNVAPQPTLGQVRQKLRNLYKLFEEKFPEYKLFHRRSSHSFPVAELRKYPQTQILGCDADLWAYGIRDLPQANRMRGMRCAGGHIHIGISPWPEKLLNRTVIQLMDMMWMPSILGRRADPHRWRYYGFPGLYRETSYGVEYRSPDNSWCSFVNSIDEDHQNAYWLIHSDTLKDLTHGVELLVRAAAKKGGLRVNQLIQEMDNSWTFSYYAALPKNLKIPAPFNGNLAAIYAMLEKEAM